MWKGGWAQSFAATILAATGLIAAPVSGQSSSQVQDGGQDRQQVRDQYQYQIQDQPIGDGEIRPGSTAIVSDTRVGQRETAEQAAPNIKPTARIATRVENRVQNRIRNRIDPFYDPTANATSPFAVASKAPRNPSGAPSR